MFKRLFNFERFAKFENAVKVRFFAQLKVQSTVKLYTNFEQLFLFIVHYWTFSNLFILVILADTLKPPLKSAKLVADGRILDPYRQPLLNTFRAVSSRIIIEKCELISPISWDAAKV